MSVKEVKKIRVCPASGIACGCPDGTQRAECDGIATNLAEAEKVRQTVSSYNY